MFGIGFVELLVIAVFGLLVFGPERLPEVIRTLAHAVARFRRSWRATRRELEQELGVDEIRKEIHNAQVLEDLQKLGNEAAGSIAPPEEDAGNSAEATGKTGGDQPQEKTAE